MFKKNSKTLRGLNFPVVKKICNFGGINFSVQPQIRQIREIKYQQNFLPLKYIELSLSNSQQWNL